MVTDVTHEEGADPRPAADIETPAAALERTYTDWWSSLDGIERRRARTFLGFGVPDDIANRMRSAGIELHPGVVGTSAGVRNVVFAPRELVQFITAHPAQ